MLDLLIALLLGVVIGYAVRPRDEDFEAQRRMYDQKARDYVAEIEYYKNLCKWHVERKDKQ